MFLNGMLEKTLESPLDYKEIKPVHPKGNQSWIFIRRTDAEAPILWPPDAKRWLIGKDPDARKDWGQEEKAMAKDEMGGCYHWLNGHKLAQTLRDSIAQGNLACCSPGDFRVIYDLVTEQQWVYRGLLFSFSIFICLTLYIIKFKRWKCCF